MTHVERQQRAREIVRLHAAGKIPKAIAIDMGITVARVHKILSEHRKKTTPPVAP